MILPSNLISDFVKATKDKQTQSKENIVYGTVQSDTGYVQLDGSTVLTPIKNNTVLVESGDRVTVMIKDHQAIVTGNIDDPAPRGTDTLKSTDLVAINASITNLEADNVLIRKSLTVTEADIETLKADNATIEGTLEANKANIESLTAETATIKDTLTAHTASIGTLETNNATINNKLTAAEANIETLRTGKLSASDIEGKYANIDFSNISQATMKEFYAGSGIIKDAVLQNGVITGELSGITISGDLIKANTLVANKLVIQGTDGLYYRLNTDGSTTEAEQTDYNSLNGSVIKAKSIIASKINVTDLQAFGATIGGFKISESSVYSGVKSSPSNTTKGIYLGSDGQLFIGDATNYLKYIVDSNGNSKLQVSADSILFGSSNKNLETALTDSSKTATNFMSLTAADGLIVGDRTGTLGGNIQLKSETDGASISIRDGAVTLVKFIATNKTFSGVTSASTSTSSDTETTEDDSGTTSETVTGASQTVVIDQTATVVKFESTNPVYFTNGVRTDKVIIGASDFISNVDFTLNGKMFDKNGRSVMDLITSEGNLSIGYGRFKNATSSSKDYTIIYGNKVRLTTKNGATITQDGSAVFESQNGNGNMVLGYHLYKKKSGNTNIYAGDNVNLRGKSVDIVDSTGNACFEAKNSSGNTTLGYARYVNGGSTNIYGGGELNLSAASGGTITAHSAFVPSSNASLPLGKSGSLGWSNIYIGNASGAYNGLRMIVGGTNENLCGRDEDGRYIFGNAGSVMHYRAKDVSSESTGNAFKITSGNDGAANNTSSVWLFGAADSTSRYIGSYLAYNRTYSSAANLVVTANGVFGRSTSSSKRYKEDISVAELDHFSGLYDLPIKKYKYKSGYLCNEDENCGKYLYGIIVEDLEDVLPCAVEHITNEDGESVPEMWNSNILIPALLKLIQDLNTRVKTLEDSALNNPIVASTEAEMTALLVAKNEGKIVKYIGPSGTYKQNTLYTIVDET